MHAASHRLPPLDDGPNELIARLVVTFLARIAGAQQHPAVPVGDRQHVQFLTFPRQANRRGGLPGIAGQQRIHQQDAVGGEPHRVVDRGQLVQVDFARRIEIGLHFGLRLGHNPVANDSHPNDAEDPAGKQDDEQEAQHQLRRDPQPEAA